MAKFSFMGDIFLVRASSQAIVRKDAIFYADEKDLKT